MKNTRRKLKAIERELSVKYPKNAKENKKQRILELVELLNEQPDLKELAPNNRTIKHDTLGDILVKTKWLTTHRKLRGIGDKRFEQLKMLIEESKEYKQIVEWIEKNAD